MSGASARNTDTPAKNGRGELVAPKIKFADFTKKAGSSLACLLAVARVRTGQPALPTTPPQSFGGVLLSRPVGSRARRPCQQHESKIR
eukprot:5672817-Prymnesium_polylepis.1